MSDCGRNHKGKGQKEGKENSGKTKPVSTGQIGEKKSQQKSKAIRLKKEKNVTRERARRPRKQKNPQWKDTPTDNASRGTRPKTSFKEGGPLKKW